MKKVPTILWLASWYPTKLDPYPGDFIQRHAKALALYHPVHVLHIAKDGKGEITKDILISECVNGNLQETIIYYHPFKTGLDLVDRLISTYKFLLVGKRFIKLMATTTTNIFIHVHVAMRHGLLAHWAKKSLGINYVITEHWTGYDRKTYPEHLRPSTWFWLATKKIFKQGSYFYPEVKITGALINETIATIPYKPVSNTVDTTLFFPAKAKIASGPFQFIHVSTLSYQKNIEGLLNVIERCANEDKAIHFTLVGPCSDYILQRVNNSPVLKKFVTLTGALSYDRVAGEMRKAHSLVMFSRHENQPCVILEALCIGLPVLSTRVGGIPEIINDSNGILVESENEKELYTAINKMVLLFNQFDLDNIAANAKAAYSYEFIGRQILEYYQQDLHEFF